MPARVHSVAIRAERCVAAVHLPGRYGAVGVLPQNVRLAVAVEVAGADHVPVQVYIVDRTGRRGGAVHLPGRRGATGVMPQNVRLAVAVEIAGADRVPARIDIVDRTGRRGA